MYKSIVVLLSMFLPFLCFAENCKDKNPPQSLQGLDCKSIALLIWNGRNLMLEYDGHYYDLEHSDQCGCKYLDDVSLLE